MHPEDLAQVLRTLPEVDDPNVLVGTATSDDAAVYALDDEMALVQTLDFFTPLVDDAFGFGQVAAANALSDLYAMGAEPMMALNIVGFPAKKLPLSILENILRGGNDKVREAGIFVLGGHSIDDAEPKYGLVVTGRVRRDRILRNVGARPGDVLVLTKPLGSGIFTTALKRDLLPREREKDIIRLMATLNDKAARALRPFDAHACTDVTGFGLLGHLMTMLRGSGVGATLQATAIPFLAEIRALAEQGCVPGGSHANFRAADGQVDWGDLADAERLILADSQTSGGLLVSLPEADAGAYVAALEKAGTAAHAIIGRVEASTADGKIIRIEGRLARAVQL